MKYISLFIFILLCCPTLKAQSKEPIIDSINQINSKDSIEIKLVVQFVVKKNGKVSDAHVQSIDCFQCTNEEKQSYIDEALRVVKNMPKIEQKNISKNTKFNLPITFMVEKPERKSNEK